jgi:hypothetical protein
VLAIAGSIRHEIPLVTVTAKFTGASQKPADFDLGISGWRQVQGSAFTRQELAKGEETA